VQTKGDEHHPESTEDDVAPTEKGLLYLARPVEPNFRYFCARLTFRVIAAKKRGGPRHKDNAQDTDQEHGEQVLIRSTWVFHVHAGDTLEESTLAHSKNEREKKRIERRKKERKKKRKRKTPFSLSLSLAGGLRRSPFPCHLPLAVQ
jgi:hypothetical protein